MKLIRWLEADELGHHTIDREHRDIVQALNDAIRALNDRRWQACSAAIDRSVDLARHHFSHEEAVLCEAGYRSGNTDHHAAYHHRLLAEADKIAELCRTNQSQDFLEARLAELIYFLIYEIRTCDRPLRRYFSSSRLTAQMGR